MKKHFKHSGLFLLYSGAFLLLLVFATGLMNNHFLLFIPLIMLIAGIIIYVRAIKKESEY